MLLPKFSDHFTFDERRVLKWMLSHEQSTTTWPKYDAVLESIRLDFNWKPGVVEELMAWDDPHFMHCKKCPPSECSWGGLNFIIEHEGRWRIDKTQVERRLAELNINPYAQHPRELPRLRKGQIVRITNILNPTPMMCDLIGKTGVMGSEGRAQVVGDHTWYDGQVHFPDNLFSPEWWDKFNRAHGGGTVGGTHGIDLHLVIHMGFHFETPELDTRDLHARAQARYQESMRKHFENHLGAPKKLPPPGVEVQQALMVSPKISEEEREFISKPLPDSPMAVRANDNMNSFLKAIGSPLGSFTKHTDKESEAPRERNRLYELGSERPVYVSGRLRGRLEMRNMKFGDEARMTVKARKVIAAASEELSERFNATKYAGPHPTRVHVCRLMTLMSLWRKSGDRHKFERLRAEQLISPDRREAWEMDNAEWQTVIGHLSKLPESASCYNELTAKAFLEQLEAARKLFEEPKADPPPVQDLFFMDRWLKTPLRSGRH